MGWTLKKGDESRITLSEAPGKIYITYSIEKNKTIETRCCKPDEAKGILSIYLTIKGQDTTGEK